MPYHSADDIKGIGVAGVRVVPTGRVGVGFGGIANNDNVAPAIEDPTILTLSGDVLTLNEYVLKLTP